LKLVLRWILVSVFQKSSSIFTRIQNHCLKKILSFFLFVLLVQGKGHAQLRYSIATHFSLLRNFSPDQQFWAFGQCVEGNFHFTKKTTAYAWINYHSDGRFTNDFTATAKSPLTTPSQVSYTVEGTWGLRHVSLGIKHYFKGEFNAEEGYNLYGLAGLGLSFAKAKNRLVSPLDASMYHLAPMPALGEDEFKRLTLDVGLGMELPVASGYFVYSDVRTSLPISDYPSPMLHHTRHVPMPVMLVVGLRLLIGYEDE